MFADFNWEIILKLLEKNTIVLSEISKFPEVNRDFALLLDESVTFQSIYDIAITTEKQLLKEVSLFDVYLGKNLPKGKKSYAVSFTIHDNRKTLTDNQIDKVMKKLQHRFETELGAELR